MKKLWTISKSKKENFAILFLIGVLIFVVAMPMDQKNKKNTFTEYGLSDRLSGKLKTDQTNTSLPSESIPQTEEQTDEYTKELQSALEELLSTMEGVGKVQVMITLKSSAEQIVEKDTESSLDSSTRTSVESGSENAAKRTEKNTTIYSDATDPFIKEVRYPKVEGVVVSAQGAESATVRKNITEAAQVLFGIDVHKIKVIKMKSK